MKFSVIGLKAFRDAHDANAELVRIAHETGKIPNLETVEIETTARVNDFYRATILSADSSGKLTATKTFYARTFDEIFIQAGDAATVQYEKVDVWPFLPTAPRKAAIAA